MMAKWDKKGEGGDGVINQREKGPMAREIAALHILRSIKLFFHLSAPTLFYLLLSSSWFATAEFYISYYCCYRNYFYSQSMNPPYSEDSTNTYFL